jgi:hypothetical protein
MHTVHVAKAEDVDWRTSATVRPTGSGYTFRTAISSAAARNPTPRCQVAPKLREPEQWLRTPRPWSADGSLGRWQRAGSAAAAGDSCPSRPRGGNSAKQRA